MSLNSGFGIILGIGFYLLFTAIPIAIAVWAFHAVKDHNESLAGIRDELRRIADARS